MPFSASCDRGSAFLSISRTKDLRGEASSVLVDCSHLLWVEVAHAVANDVLEVSVHNLVGESWRS